MGALDSSHNHSGEGTRKTQWNIYCHMERTAQDTTEEGINGVVVEWDLQYPKIT